MAAALGYAVSQPPYVSLAILEAVAVGLALPYVAIAFIPQARRLLPRPGAWKAPTPTGALWARSCRS